MKPADLPKLSHSHDRRRAAERSAAWHRFRPGETWLPYGYRAEIGQMMVCGELGIVVSDADFSNNAAYVASWLEKLRSDRKEIFRAAADAQRIADYLLAFHPDYATSQAGPPESVSSIADDGDAADTPEPMPVAA